ncbi:Uncharacterised protein [uncultured archaeon]|nr:Uncharacterised protein [uncultured archaeon]
MDVTRKIRDVNRTLLVSELFQIILNSLIIFLTLSIILSILGITLFLGLIVAGMAFIIMVVWDEVKRDPLKRISEVYPTLKERVRTAYDNRHRHNLITESLNIDVYKRMDLMEDGRFVDDTRIIYKVVGSFILIFLLLTVTVIDLHGILANIIGSDGLLRNQLNQAVDRVTGGQFDVTGNKGYEGNENYKTDQEKEKLGAESGGDRPGYNEGPIPGKGGGVGSDGTQDIFGEASSANLNGKDLNVKLHPEYGGDIDIEEVAGGKKAGDFVIGEVQSTQVCEECAVGPEHAEIVRKYFESILEEK